MAVDDTVMGSKPRFEISTLVSFDVTTKPPRVDEICMLLFGFSLLKDCVFCRACSENVVSYENAVHEAGHIMEETFVFFAVGFANCFMEEEEENQCFFDSDEPFHRFLCADMTTDGEIGKI